MKVTQQARHLDVSDRIAPCTRMLTLLIDREVNPTKTVEGLTEIKVQKLEIIQTEKVIETIKYSLN